MPDSAPETFEGEAGRSSLDRDAGPTRGQTIYLGIFIGVCFLFSIVFMLLAAWSIFVPAIGISFLFGLTVATLAYAFLGSRGHDRVEIRGIQIGGSAAVVIAFVYFTSGPLEKQIGNLQELAFYKQHAMDREVIVEAGRSVTLPGNVRVSLIGINTLNGWNEGPHATNKARRDIALILERITKQLDIPGDPSDLLEMSDDEWREFVAGLPSAKRDRLGAIPFASMEFHASDGTSFPKTLFRQDVVPVENAEGETEVFVCITRVLDVRERRSGESEIVVLTHSPQRCS